MNQAQWGRNFDPRNKDLHNEECTNTHIVLFIKNQEDEETRDRELWTEFRGHFDGWTKEMFVLATRKATQDLRTTLVQNGVWVPLTDKASYSDALIQVLDEDSQHKWTEEEILEQLESNRPFNSKYNPRPRTTSTVRDETPETQIPEDYQGNGSRRYELDFVRDNSQGISLR